MRMDWNFEFGRQQHHCHDFVHTTESASVDLAVINGSGLQKLLEDNSVLAMLPSSHGDLVLLQQRPYLGMSQNIIWRSRLLDEQRFKMGKLSQIGFDLRNRPNLEHRLALSNVCDQ